MKPVVWLMTFPMIGALFCLAVVAETVDFVGYGLDDVLTRMQDYIDE